MGKYYVQLASGEQFEVKANNYEEAARYVAKSLSNSNTVATPFEFGTNNPNVAFTVSGTTKTKFYGVSYKEKNIVSKAQPFKVCIAIHITFPVKDIQVNSRDEAIAYANEVLENTNFGRCEDCQTSRDVYTDNSNGVWEVHIPVNFHFYVSVRAKSKDEALQKAAKLFDVADLGATRNFDGDIKYYSIQYENGQIEYL